MTKRSELEKLTATKLREMAHAYEEIKGASGLAKGDASPYRGRYPCGSLVHNGVWYYGTYCLAPDGLVPQNLVAYDRQPGLDLNAELSRLVTRMEGAGKQSDSGAGSSADATQNAPGEDKT